MLLYSLHTGLRSVAFYLDFKQRSAIFYCSCIYILCIVINVMFVKDVAHFKYAFYIV